MGLFKFTIVFAVYLFSQTVNAADKVLAIPIPQMSSAVQSTPMTEKRLPKSLNHLSPKIVGGTSVRRNEFPEFTHLFVDGLDGFVYSICGATLLSRNKVLTAAHCTDGISAGRFYVLPNFYSFNDNFSFSDMIPVTKKNQHPDFQKSTQFDNDIAILTLSRQSNTPTAKLFSGSDQLANFQATVTGTGDRFEDAGKFPGTLHKVSVPIVSNEICMNEYGDSAITDNMLCAGFSDGGKGTCQGDSGGPLWVNIGGEKVQAGIVSWGIGCARPNFYGVYARTSALIDFILKHVPDVQMVTKRSKSMEPALQMLLFDEVKLKVKIPFKAIQVAAGEDHSCARQINGQVKCWGSNGGGQLGDGSYDSKKTAILVNGISNATNIATGYYHSCAVLSSGQVMCWGKNSSG